MCGISGFTWEDKSAIQRMNALLKHRGPDSEGVYTAPEVSLGHTRLAIVDLSPRGAQPMASDDGAIAVSFNGEIYNFQELRAELEQKGHAFRSESDTEVILRAYEAYGIDCVKKFNGIFAIALWDGRQKKLYLIRDHIGVKPLYYFWDSHRLIFASEIKAILSHDIPRAVDGESVNIYFRMLYVPAPRTMFRHIFKVEPGSYLAYDGKTIAMHRYWRPPAAPRIGSRDEAVRSIRVLLKDSVKRQLISERPVGVFLSGGVDSTAVLGMAHEVLGAGVQTFSAGFDVLPEKFNADLTLARKTSKHYGTRHHELIITGADCAEHLPAVVASMDEPVANATQVATYLLSRFARNDIVVALGGDGGDELFGGYERYRLSAWVSRVRKVPGAAFLAGVAGARGEKFTLPPGADRYLAFMAQKERDVSRVMARGSNDGSVLRRAYAEQYFSEQTDDAENDLMWADVRSWLPDESLVRSDKLSMAVALEQRVPILDYRLVELSRRIPSAWKFSAFETKTLFKEAVAAYLPPHLAHQPKRGWFSPASAWLRGPVRPLMEEVLSDGFAPGSEEFLDLPEIRRMFADHLAVRSYHMQLLWAALTFRLWYRHFIYGHSR
jgi:asparagine synthase (glutamine-hydrolysing)